jgi:hypothetical protein
MAVRVAHAKLLAKLALDILERSSVGWDLGSTSCLRYEGEWCLITVIHSEYMAASCWPHFGLI